MTRVVAAVGLLALWIVLWRDPSPANVLSGAALAVLLSFSVRPRRSHRVRPIALLVLAGYFLRKLIEANVVLAVEILTPRNKISTGIVGVHVPEASDLVLTIVANAVSLTPGTLTLEVVRAPDSLLYVHVLHLHDVEQARQEVREMAKRVAAAFPQTTGTMTEVEST